MAEHNARRRLCQQVPGVAPSSMHRQGPYIRMPAPALILEDDSHCSKWNPESIFALRGVCSARYIHLMSHEKSGYPRITLHGHGVSALVDRSRCGSMPVYGGITYIFPHRTVTPPPYRFSAITAHSAPPYERRHPRTPDGYYSPTICDTGGQTDCAPGRVWETHLPAAAHQGAPELAAAPHHRLVTGHRRNVTATKTPQSGARLQIPAPLLKWPRAKISGAQVT